MPTPIRALLAPDLLRAGPGVRFAAYDRAAEEELEDAEGRELVQHCRWGTAASAFLDHGDRAAVVVLRVGAHVFARPALEGRNGYAEEEYVVCVAELQLEIVEVGVAGSAQGACREGGGEEEVEVGEVVEGFG